MNTTTVSVTELKQAYEELPESDRLFFAALIAADQMTHQPEFIAYLGRQHQSMDEGKKWSHDDVMRLHRELEKQGI